MLDFQDEQKEIIQLRQENLKLRKRIIELESQLGKTSSGEEIRKKAKLAIQKKKEVKRQALQCRIKEILNEEQNISTKCLVERLNISNKTFYNLNLKEYFNHGGGI